MRKTILSKDTLIPVGAVVATVALAVGMVRSMDRTGLHDAEEMAVLRERVTDLDRRVNDLKDREDKNDQRWDRIKDDLAAIKERLGIVESRPHVAGQH